MTNKQKHADEIFEALNWALVALKPDPANLAYERERKKAIALLEQVRHG